MKCVRCNLQFNKPFHPMSHLSTICQECNSLEPENIYDQQAYYFKQFLFSKESVDELIKEIK